MAQTSPSQRARRDPAAQAWFWDETTKRWVNQATGQISDPSANDPYRMGGFRSWGHILKRLGQIGTVAGAGYGTAALSGAFAPGAAAATAGTALPEFAYSSTPIAAGDLAPGTYAATAAPAAVAAGAGADYLGPKPPQSRSPAARSGAEGASRLPPWQQALLGLANLPPALIASRQNRPTAEEQAMQQQIQQMLAQQQRRTTTQDPLFEAVTRLAMNRLPTNVQQPIERL